MTREDLLREIDGLVAAGDEKAIEKFLIDHYEDLPKDAQGSLLLSLYTKALEKEADEIRVAQFQEEGLQALDALAAMKDPNESAQ